MYETTTRIELPAQGRTEVPVEGSDETVTEYEFPAQIIEPGEKVSKANLREHGQSDEDVASLLERGVLVEG